MNAIRGVIFDIDGVLIFQGRVYPNAIEVVDTLRAKGIVLRFLTNSTLNSRASCTEKLRQSGFHVLEDEVITASYATAVYLRSQNPVSCWVLVDREGIQEFKEFVQDTDNPEYIVIGDNRSQFNFDHLNKVLRHLVNGARLIAMQSELIDTSMGNIELNVGSWVGMLERAAGVRAVSIGKPNPYVFELALHSMHLDKNDLIMVGDRITTDIQGANYFGLRSVLIKTGEFDERDLVSEIVPTYTFETIGELLELFS